MKKSVCALALGLVLSATVAANNRSVSTPLPAATPSVTLTLNGQTTTVQPDKLTLRENDANHVTLTVNAKTNKAAVSLPISYDNCLAIGIRLAETLKDLHLMSADDYSKCLDWYQKQTGSN